MDEEKKECGAHNIMLSVVMRVQQQQDKISEEVSESNVRMGVVELQVSSLNDNFKSFREENERHQTAQNENYNRLFILLEQQEKERKKNKWRPVHTVALITSIFGPAALVASAWITAKLKVVVP